ncbi:MAG: tagaturonate epimerase family protein [Phycisphaerae bacterium]
MFEFIVMMKLGKYSFGLGDRFALQGRAQLQAILKAEKLGVDITPVWNKSHREHTIIGTEPADVRAEADEAVKSLNFKNSYFVDADHINLKNVDLFIDSSDFFTIDVADYIGQSACDKDIETFVKKYSKYIGRLDIPNIDEPVSVTQEKIGAIAKKFLLAVKEAGKIYRRIEKLKGRGNFIAEISMDESDQPQTPVELLFILAAIADERIPVQTIAPKFTGRFNKGVDYAGDISQFEMQFNDDLAIIAFAVREFDLPANLKLSIHSGSDKFSIYKPINKALKKFNAGLHLKTAGTTWLEELIGMAASNSKGLALAKDIYVRALMRIDELCEPYRTVIDIDIKKLPLVKVVQNWSSDDYVNALRHDLSCRDYNPNLRQLLHVGYKIAAETGNIYLDTVRENEKIIAEHVTKNIFDRHIKSLFIN